LIPDFAGMMKKVDFRLFMNSSNFIGLISFTPAPLFPIKGEGGAGVSLCHQLSDCCPNPLKDDFIYKEFTE
jgi:hypothetical protein